MAETYSKILPGNWTVPLSAYPLPNAGTGRGVASGRRQQSALFMPGWKAIHKVGYAFVDDAGAAEFDIILPSPDTRPDDKPRADVKGLYVPTGAHLYRVGLRVPGVSEQPGYYSSGPRGVLPDAPEDAGLVGTATDMLAVGSALPASQAGGSITPTAAHTSTLAACKTIFGADKRLKEAQEYVCVNPWDGTAGPTTADLTFKLFVLDTTGAAAGDPIKSDLLGGVYLIAEVCYLVPDDVEGFQALKISGASFGGYGN